MREPEPRGSGDRAGAVDFPGSLPLDDIERIGILAAKSVGADRELRRRIVPQLVAAHERRRDLAEASAGKDRGLRTELPGRSMRVLWGTLCVALAAAMIALSATFGPIKHLSSTRPEASWPIACTAAIIGLSAAAILHLLPAPRRGYLIYVAEVLGWVCSGQLALVIFYRAFALHWRETAYSPEQLLIWYLSAATVVLLTVLLVLRWRRRRGQLSPEERLRGARRAPSPDAAALAGALVALAEGGSGIPQVVLDDWADRIEREGRLGNANPERASAAAVAAVARLDPIEVLARIYADGNIGVERITRGFA